MFKPEKCPAPSALAEHPPVGWRISDGPVAYEASLAAMEARAEAIARGDAGELVWLLEHPALYTVGTSGTLGDVLAPRFPVHRTNRGGQVTYHGPGQRVAYLMLDLNRRGRDVRRFVCDVERWTMCTLEAFNVGAQRREGRVGVWVPRPEKGLGREDKIAAIGVRVRRWVTFHGLSLNVDPDLTHFDGIVPCGIADQGVTSLVDLGRIVTLAEVDMALRESFEEVFGPTVDET